MSDLVVLNGVVYYGAHELGLNDVNVLLRPFASAGITPALTSDDPHVPENVTVHFSTLQRIAWAVFRLTKSENALSAECETLYKERERLYELLDKR